MEDRMKWKVGKIYYRCRKVPDEKIVPCWCQDFNPKRIANINCIGACNNLHICDYDNIFVRLYKFIEYHFPKKCNLKDFVELK
jgi:hypothetical protein